MLNENFLKEIKEKFKDPTYDKKPINNNEIDKKDNYIEEFLNKDTNKFKLTLSDIEEKPKTQKMS